MIIKEQASLKPHTTFMTEAKTRYFCEVSHEGELKELLESELWKSVPQLIIGKGSNLLVIEDLNALVVSMNICGRHITEESPSHLIIQVAAGEPWHDFVMDMAEQGYWGIENLALIPGTVGAAPVQNIGAYGVEVKERIVSVDVIDRRTHTKRTLSNEECSFSYRNSIFKRYPHRYIVTGVSFKLSKNPQPRLEYGALKEASQNLAPTSISPKEIAHMVMSIRRSKLPYVGEIGMAGSFFKNPIISKEKSEKLLQEYPSMPIYRVDSSRVKISAGWIIETLGYKGIKKGEVGTYHKHALVLVNHGNASGKELWNFAQTIIRDSKKTFGIPLEPEVLVVDNNFLKEANTRYDV